jgi:hypothetical protein
VNQKRYNSPTSARLKFRIVREATLILKGLDVFNLSGSSVCVMQWTGVIRDETLIEKDIAAIFANYFRSRTN